jgi:hypothetical protein
MELKALGVAIEPIEHRVTAEPAGQDVGAYLLSRTFSRFVAVSPGTSGHFRVSKRAPIPS